MYINNLLKQIIELHFLNYIFIVNSLELILIIINIIRIILKLDFYKLVY